jgi:hypothetical protein
MPVTGTLSFHDEIRRLHQPVSVLTAIRSPPTGGADRFAAEFRPEPLDLHAPVFAIRRCPGVARSMQPH